MQDVTSVWKDDTPYLQNGTLFNMVINPLWISSPINVGQILLVFDM